VTKLRTVTLLTFVGFASGFVGYFSLNLKNPHSLNALTVSTMAVAFACMGANALTSYIDRDIDALMERTRRRPLPMGKISPPQRAVYYGLALLSLGLVVQISYGYYGVFWILFGLTFNILVYNAWLKRKTPANIILGAFAGGAPVMVVWSSVTGELLSLTPLLMAALIVLWTPIHIWSLTLRYRDDYVRVKVPMLPVVVEERKALRCVAFTSILLVIFSVLLFFLNIFGLVYLVTAGLLGCVMVLLSLRLFLHPTKQNSWVVFKFSSPYLMVIFLAMIIDLLLMPKG